MTYRNSIKTALGSRWMLIATLSVALVVGFYVSYAWAATINCTGGGANCIGSDTNDQINGTNTRDKVYAHAGNDLVYAKEGNDYVEGNADIDLIYAAEGNDEVHGGNGDDRALYSGALYGGDGIDYVYGEDGIDTLYGNDGSDVLAGGDDNDAIWSQDGIVDAVNGGAGYNNCYADAIDNLVNCP